MNGLVDGVKKMRQEQLFYSLNSNPSVDEFNGSPRMGQHGPLKRGWRKVRRISLPFFLFLSFNKLFGLLRLNKSSIEVACLDLNFVLPHKNMRFNLSPFLVSIQLINS